MVEQIARLGRVVLPSNNTPMKGIGDTLYPSPRWKYKGPATQITITYQVGRWGTLGFAGDTQVVTEVINQAKSDDWSTFEPTTALKGVVLSGLKASDDDKYDMEMWFKASGMSDQGAIFTDCCEVPAAKPGIEISSCSFS